MIATDVSPSCSEEFDEHTLLRFHHLLLEFNNVSLGYQFLQTNEVLYR